jgi:hypothetical protein
MCQAYRSHGFNAKARLRVTKSKLGRLTLTRFGSFFHEITWLSLAVALTARSAVWIYASTFELVPHIRSTAELSVYYPLNLSLSRPCVRDFIDGCHISLQEAPKYKGVTFGTFSRHDIHTGNAIVMLMAAVLFCKIVGIKHIDGAPLAGVFHTFTTTDGITVWANGTFPLKSDVFSGSIFASWGIPICADWNMTSVSETFRKQFIATLPRKEIPDDTVVLHMRGGEMMSLGSPGNYWQPPCSFYTNIQKQYSHTILLSQDTLNPCVEIAIKQGAVWQRGDFMDAFTTMVWAKNLAISRSSFCKASLYMSAVRKNFYVFEGDSNSINGRWNTFTGRFLDHGDHWDCLASNEYHQMIVPDDVGIWNANATQKEFLTRDVCTLKRITIAERSYIPLPSSRHDVGFGWFVTM